MKLRKEVPVKTDDSQTRLALLEQSLGQINNMLLKVEKKMDDNFNFNCEQFRCLHEKIDVQFRYSNKEISDKYNFLDQKIDEKFKILDHKLETVRTHSWSQFRWLIGAIITIGGGVLAPIIIQSIHLFLWK